MTLEQRFDKLERANRQWRLATVVLGTIVVVLVFTARPQSGASSTSAATGPKAPELIQARRFAVVDDKGNTLVNIGENARGAGEISIFNARKQKLVSLIGDDLFGGGLLMSDSNGRTKVMMTSPKDTGGVIRALNTSGKWVVELSATGDGGGSVAVFNNRDKPIVVLQPDKQNAGQLGVNDADGNVKRAFGVAP